jgi:predicted nucleic acid-binding protein
VDWAREGLLWRSTLGEDLLDELIAATRRRYDASIWTLDKDYQKFPPKTLVRVMRT